jgi:hypothetical protein
MSFSQFHDTVYKYKYRRGGQYVVLKFGAVNQSMLHHDPELGGGL